MQMTEHCEHEHDILQVFLCLPLFASDHSVQAQFWISPKTSAAARCAATQTHRRNAGHKTKANEAWERRGEKDEEKQVVVTWLPS